MEPTNKNQRKTAIGRFVGMYVLSLTFPLAAVYLLMRVPDSVAASETRRYRQIVEEQDPMLVDTDTLSQISRRLIQLDGLYSSATDEMAKATARTQLVDIESRINSIMSHFNNLAASAAHEQNKRLSTGIAKLTEALVTYRQTIGELRRTLDSKGIDMQMVNDLRDQINMKDLELKVMEEVVVVVVVPTRSCKQKWPPFNATSTIAEVPNRGAETLRPFNVNSMSAWQPEAEPPLPTANGSGIQKQKAITSC